MAFLKLDKLGQVRRGGGEWPALLCVVCCEVAHAVKLWNAISAAVPNCCSLPQGRHGKKAKKEEEDEDDDDDDAMSSDDEVEEDDNGGEEPPKMHYRCAAAFAAVGH